MTVFRKVSSVGIVALLAAGAVLAVALLVETVVNYQYVTTNLVRQEARRAAQDRVREVEHAVRMVRPPDAAGVQAVLDELHSESSDQMAAIALLARDGTIVAASGETAPSMTSAERERFLADRTAPFTQVRRDNRDVLVGVFACRCGLPGQAQSTGNEAAAGRPLLEIALYRDSLSSPFTRLRRNAIIGALSALALFVSVSLIAARFGSYVRGKQAEAQADLARQVQRDLLPGGDALPPGIDVAALCLPAWQVGGDFYDVVSLPNGSAAFSLGDVSGHGMSAALLMGLIHGAMSSPPWGVPDEDPAMAAARLNHLLVTKSSGERFASLFWCAYDPAGRTLRYINAGHLPPLWFRRGDGGATTLDRLTVGGPVLGVLDTARYRTVSVPASDGDLLVLFSDGIVEATNRRGEPFGEARLIDAVRTRLDQPARAISDAVVAALQEFMGTAPVRDDRTLLIVRLWRAA
jgi:Stage II sporulation protein E (SpoIIE)